MALMAIPHPEEAAHGSALCAARGQAPRPSRRTHSADPAEFNFFTCSQGRDTEGKHMQQHTGWMCVFAFFALLAAADAQAPASPTVSTQFDGTYAFVSGTKVGD